MKNQKLFIHQLYILFCFGTLVIFLLVLRNNDISIERSPKEDSALELIWSGNELIVDYQRNIDYEKNISARYPVDLVPLFFEPIPINEAGFDLLQTVPGIGPKLASEIGITRKRLGKFEKEEDLLLVHGIGRKKMNLFKNYFSFQ